MALSVASTAGGNGLLTCLKTSDRDLLAPRLERVKLGLRQPLEFTNRQIGAAYFIEQGIVSVVTIGGGHRPQSEVGLVGREGMTGLAIVLGQERSAHDAFVQAEGTAQRIAAEDLQNALQESRTLLATLLRYAYVWSMTLAQTALANARGSLEERLARWLLMAHDRSDGDEIHLTHEFLSLMLGTRRAGVTTALNAFDTRGWIDHARGRVTIVHRRGLEQLASGFYGIPETEYGGLIRQRRQA
jgi:CRP-like cAMP-binding protein